MKSLKYKINKLNNGKYALIKTLKEYNNEEDASFDLMRIISKKVTEKELLEEHNYNLKRNLKE